MDDVNVVNINFENTASNTLACVKKTFFIIILNFIVTI